MRSSLLSGSCSLLLILLGGLACRDNTSPSAPTEPPPIPAPLTPDPAGDGTAAPPPEASAAAAAATASRISARHILIAYVGALGAGYKTTREKAEARALADQLHQQLTTGGADFESLARQHSNDSSATLGGHLGAFERGVMQADFERTAFALAENQISAVVETPFGFHIIQRLPLQEIHVAHVLVQWAGLPQAETARSREEARAHAEAALQKLQAGTPIDNVAREFSDGPTATRGGDLGWFQRGQMVPAFDNAAFALKPGETSSIVESPLGFHIIHRLE